MKRINSRIIFGILTSVCSGKWYHTPPALPALTRHCQLSRDMLNVFSNEVRSFLIADILFFFIYFIYVPQIGNPAVIQKPKSATNDILLLLRIHWVCFIHTTLLDCSHSLVIGFRLISLHICSETACSMDSWILGCVDAYERTLVYISKTINVWIDWSFHGFRC